MQGSLQGGDNEAGFGFDVLVYFFEGGNELAYGKLGVPEQLAPGIAGFVIEQLPRFGFEENPRGDIHHSGYERMVGDVVFALVEIFCVFIPIVLESVGIFDTFDIPSHGVCDEVFAFWFVSVFFEELHEHIAARVGFLEEGFPLEFVHLARFVVQPVMRFIDLGQLIHEVEHRLLVLEALLGFFAFGEIPVGEGYGPLEIGCFDEDAAVGFAEPFQVQAIADDVGQSTRREGVGGGVLVDEDFYFFRGCDVAYETVLMDIQSGVIAFFGVRVLEYETGSSQVAIAVAGEFQLERFIESFEPNQARDFAWDLILDFSFDDVSIHPPSHCMQE